MWGPIGSTTAIFVIAMLSVSSSTPTNKTTTDGIRKCAPNFCQVALFKCISKDSCNGTLVEPTDPCQCCPSCKMENILGEGEICEGDAVSEKSPVTTEILETSSSHSKNEMKTEENTEKNGKHSGAAEKKCKSGLTCLQGRCVTVY